LGYLVVATITYDFCLREVNFRADAFALDVTGRSDGLIQSAIMTNGARTVDPAAVEEFLFYSHPSLNSRIAHALEWKAARP
jgi:STE24 endopeptidase